MTSLQLATPAFAKPNQALREIICRDTTTWSVKQFGNKLRAIVLTGSLARDEATFQRIDDKWSARGDAEFFLVVHEGVPLPSDATVLELAKEIEARLRILKIHCHLSLAASHEAYFRKLKPHILAYELMIHGRTIWGDEKILSLIPRFSTSDIPLEDGWRLLCNRMIEFIEAAAETADDVAIVSQKVHYQTIKLLLDMTTSYLLFAGTYATTYRDRADRLKDLSQTAPGDAPFPLKKFAKLITDCTRLKLGEAEQVDDFVSEEPADLWLLAVEYAVQLWRWELGILTGQKRSTTGDAELMKYWMTCQPPTEKIRGWLYVLRKQGWHRSCEEWPRWSRCGLRASPRYWVYAAASELFFRLPLLLQPNDQRRLDLDWDGLRRLLPITTNGDSDNSQSNWHHLASDIAWNYHEFLEGTRA